MTKIEIENPYIDKDIQKALNKLISEEWIASNFYQQMVFGCIHEERGVICELFTSIANDELHDHMKSLVDWCMQNGYDIPCKMSDFRRYASSNDVKLFDTFKPKQNAKYYIQKGIESEKSALQSYKTIIDQGKISQFTDLQSIIWNNYYDEQEHLEKLNSALIAYEANADMIMM